MNTDSEHKLNVAKIMHFLFDMVENIVVTGENASYSIFFFCHDVF